MNIQVSHRNIQVSHRESDDGYATVVARLNARWRVIVCRDTIQCIVQRFDGMRAHRAQWRSVWYFRTRDALVRLCGASLPSIDPTSLAVLRALPARIDEVRS